MTQRHSQLLSTPLKGVQVDLQGLKLKTEPDYQVRSMSQQLELRAFPLPGALLAINYLCQQKALFKVSYQMKARVKVDRELTWFGAFLVS